MRENYLFDRLGLVAVGGFEPLPDSYGLCAYRLSVCRFRLSVCLLNLRTGPTPHRHNFRSSGLHFVPPLCLLLFTFLFNKINKMSSVFYSLGNMVKVFIATFTGGIAA